MFTALNRSIINIFNDFFNLSRSFSAKTFIFVQKVISSIQNCTKVKSLKDWNFSYPYKIMDGLGNLFRKNSSVSQSCAAEQQIPTEINPEVIGESERNQLDRDDPVVLVEEPIYAACGAGAPMSWQDRAYQKIIQRPPLFFLGKEAAKSRALRDNFDESYPLIKSKIEESNIKYFFSFDDTEKRFFFHAPINPIKVLLPQTLQEFFAPISLRNASRADFLDYLLPDSKLKNPTLEAKRKDFADKYHKLQKIEKAPFSGEIEQILDRNLCVGELHKEKAPKRFIIDNLEIFKERGYETIFLEFLMYDSAIQDFLDEYLSAPLEEEMPDSLKFCLRFHSDHIEIVTKAKALNMRVIGIDTEVSFEFGNDTQFGHQGSERMYAMNYQAKEIIAKESQGKKWIALIGNAHMSTCYGVPGVSEIIPNCLAIDVYERDQEAVTCAINPRVRQCGSEGSLIRDMEIVSPKNPAKVSFDDIFSQRK